MLKKILKLSEKDTNIVPNLVTKEEEICLFNINLYNEPFSQVREVLLKLEDLGFTWPDGDIPSSFISHLKKVLGDSMLIYISIYGNTIKISTCNNDHLSNVDSMSCDYLSAISDEEYESHIIDDTCTYYNFGKKPESILETLSCEDVLKASSKEDFPKYKLKNLKELSNLDKSSKKNPKLMYYGNNETKRFLHMLSEIDNAKKALLNSSSSETPVTTDDVNLYFLLTFLGIDNDKDSKVFLIGYILALAHSAGKVKSMHKNISDLVDLLGGEDSQMGSLGLLAKLMGKKYSSRLEINDSDSTSENPFG